MMGCGCIEHTESELSKTRKLADKLAKAEQADYIIYKENGKIYCDKKSCWEKAGRPGEFKELVCAI